MAYKKTNESLDAELSDSPYLRVGSYLGANIPIEFECKICGDRKLRRPSAVLANKNKCVNCFNKSRAKSGYTFDEELSKKTSNIKRVGNYVNNYTKIKFKCSLGHIWETTPHHALNAKISCPECVQKSKRLSNSKYDSKLAQLNATVYRVESYINSKTAILHKCDKNHEWLARPSNILAGRGCPHCVEKFGFKRNKPAMLYYIKITNGSMIRFKIGVTNSDIKTRFKNDKDKLIELLWSKNFNTGTEALLAESYILNNSPDPPVTEFKFLKSNGNTELYNTDILYWIKGLYK